MIELRVERNKELKTFKTYAAFYLNNILTETNHSMF